MLTIRSSRFQARSCRSALLALSSLLSLLLLFRLDSNPILLPQVRQLLSRSFLAVSNVIGCKCTRGARPSERSLSSYGKSPNPSGWRLIDYVQGPRAHLVHSVEKGKLDHLSRLSRAIIPNRPTHAYKAPNISLRFNRGRKMPNADESKYTIITGQYETGTQEQKGAISRVLGPDQTEYKYKVYFYWYNVIHELGHAILHFNQHDELHHVEEELVANDFAVAYWSHYGEDPKINALRDIVQSSIPRLDRPAPAGMDYIAYARANWGKEELFTFSNYGWFQFSSVLDSLRNQKPLASMLRIMSHNNIDPQPKQVLSYDIDQQKIPLKIVEDATLILRKWGITLPSLPHLMVHDPYRHGISTVGY